METPVIVAFIVGSITAVGWLVNHWLSGRREEQRRRIEAQLKFVERQIEELYGPLAFLVYEGERNFTDLLDALGRRFVFSGNRPLPEEEIRTWLFWAETEFLPRNEKIKHLLMSKTHLVEGPAFPDSYIEFLNHCILGRLVTHAGKNRALNIPGIQKSTGPTHLATRSLLRFNN